MERSPDNALIVAGTDTGVGKTFVCAQLLAYLRQRDIEAGYQKLVSTGDSGTPADLAFCRETAGYSPDPAFDDIQVPYSFRYAASPHLAGEAENDQIDPARLVQSFRRMCARYELVVVEGAGGLLVPLRRDLLQIDLMARLNVPVLVVARSGLGTLNHTLLSLEALRKRRLFVLGVIFCDTAPEATDDKIIADNRTIIAEIGRTRFLGHLPHTSTFEEARRLFAPIGEEILSLHTDTGSSHARFD